MREGRDKQMRVPRFCLWREERAGHTRRKGRINIQNTQMDIVTKMYAFSHTDTIHDRELRDTHIVFSPSQQQSMWTQLLYRKRFISGLISFPSLTETDLSSTDLKQAVTSPLYHVITHLYTLNPFYKMCLRAHADYVSRKRLFSPSQTLCNKENEAPLFWLPLPHSQQISCKCSFGVEQESPWAFAAKSQQFFSSSLIHTLHNIASPPFTSPVIQCLPAAK